MSKPKEPSILQRLRNIERRLEELERLQEARRQASQRAERILDRAFKKTSTKS